MGPAPGPPGPPGPTGPNRAQPDPKAHRESTGPTGPTGLLEGPVAGGPVSRSTTHHRTLPRGEHARAAWSTPSLPSPETAPVSLPEVVRVQSHPRGAHPPPACGPPGALGAGQTYGSGTKGGGDSRKCGTSASGRASVSRNISPAVRGTTSFRWGGKAGRVPALPPFAAAQLRNLPPLRNRHMPDHPKMNNARPVMRQRPGEAQPSVAVVPFITPDQWESPTEAPAGAALNPRSAMPAVLCQSCAGPVERHAADQLEDQEGWTREIPPRPAHRPSQTDRPPTVGR